MSCNYCNGLFCLYSIEKRCPSCGFSFCVKCLDNKIFVKQLKANKKVCVKCAKFNSSGDVHEIPPPDYYKKTSHCDTKSESKFGENDYNRTRPQYNIPEIQNESGFNVPDMNGHEPDLNLPSTSQNQHGIIYGIAKRASEPESSDDEDYSGEVSEEWDDEINDEDLESKRSLSPDLMETHPYLYVDTSVERDPRSTNEILREALNRVKLKKGLGDNGGKMETLNKKPPQCVLCSTEEAQVNCQGCESHFCIRCFDLHSDEVCATHEPLDPHVSN